MLFRDNAVNQILVLCRGSPRIEIDQLEGRGGVNAKATYVFRSSHDSKNQFKGPASESNYSS